MELSAKMAVLLFTQGISLDFYYLERFSEFTVPYYEFNGFKSLEKTTTEIQLLLMLKEMTKRTKRRRFLRARLFCTVFWIRPGRCGEWWDNCVTGRVAADE